MKFSSTSSTNFSYCYQDTYLLKRWGLLSCKLVTMMICGRPASFRGCATGLEFSADCVCEFSLFHSSCSLLSLVNELASCALKMLAGGTIQYRTDPGNFMLWLFTVLRYSLRTRLREISENVWTRKKRFLRSDILRKP